MGSRHLGSLLLRPAPLSRLTTPRPSSSITCLRLPPPQILPSTSRHLSTSPLTRAAQPQAKEDTSPDDETTSIIDSLFDMPKQPNRTAPPRTAPPRTASFRTNSADELDAVRRTFGSEFSRPSNSSIRPRVKPNFDDLMFTPEEPEPQQALAIPEEEIKYPRLNPAYGRTVNLDPEKGRDIVRGINMLGSLMARNKVRSDFMKQRYHERPGLKRKRLHSERWRSRFKSGFDGVCKRVQELTRKGW